MYDLCGKIPLETETFAGFLTLWGRALNGAARMADGAYCVPMGSLLFRFPKLTALAAEPVCRSDGTRGEPGPYGGKRPPGQGSMAVNPNNIKNRPTGSVPVSRFYCRKGEGSS